MAAKNLPLPFVLAQQIWGSGFRTAIEIFGIVYGPSLHRAMPAMCTALHTKSRTFDELKIGDFEEMTDDVNEGDTVRFAFASKDMNPAHIDDEFMADSGYGRSIAHGMRIASLVSATMTKFFGPGTIYDGQSCWFKGPVYHGDIVTSRVEVIALKRWTSSSGKVCERAALRTTVHNQRGELVFRGRGIIVPPKQKTLQ